MTLFQQSCNLYSSVWQNASSILGSSCTRMSCLVIPTLLSLSENVYWSEQQLPTRSKLTDAG